MVEVEKSKKTVTRIAIDTLFTTLEKTGVMAWFGNLINARVPQIIDIQWQNPEAEQKFIKLTAEGGIPEGFAGHFVWYDAVLASQACSTLQDSAQRHGLGDNLLGFGLTLAKSVKEGQQSRFMKAIYPEMEKFAADRNVEFIPITRVVDADRYGMARGLNFEEKKALVAKFRQKGMGGMIFPGGSVQPGRRPKGGTRDQINGLQEITDADLWNVFELMEREGQSRTGQKPYFLPMGIEGGYRLQSAQSKLPTPEALVSLFGRLSEFLGEKIGFKRIRARVKIGMPITLKDVTDELGVDWEVRIRNRNDDEGWQRAALELNRYLMMRSANLLEDPQARGFYGKD